MASLDVYPVSFSLSPIVMKKIGGMPIIYPTLREDLASRLNYLCFYMVLLFVYGTLIPPHTYIRYTHTLHILIDHTHTLMHVHVLAHIHTI